MPYFSATLSPTSSPLLNYLLLTSRPPCTYFAPTLYLPFAYPSFFFVTLYIYLSL